LLALCAGVSLVLGGAARAAAPDNALQFNGSSQYVTFGPSAGTGAGGLGATQFTLETWFKKTGVGVAVSSGSGGLGAAVPLVTKGRGESEREWGRPIRHDAAVESRVAAIVAAIAASRPTA